VTALACFHDGMEYLLSSLWECPNSGSAWGNYYVESLP